MLSEKSLKMTFEEFVHREREGSLANAKNKSLGSRIKSKFMSFFHFWTKEARVRRFFESFSRKNIRVRILNLILVKLHESIVVFITKLVNWVENFRKPSWFKFKIWRSIFY